MRRSRPVVLAIDPIACDGHGVCAELLPEWIRLDDWGYPIIHADAVPAELLDRARWAISNCPALALSLRAEPVAVGGVRSGSR
jgi:ferredoxin